MQVLANLDLLQKKTDGIHILADDYNKTTTSKEFKNTLNVKLGSKEEKKYIVDEILSRIRVNSRLILTSDLYTSLINITKNDTNSVINVSQDIEKNYSNFFYHNQPWPWVKYSILSLLTGFPSSKINFFYKYYQTDLSSKLKIFFSECENLKFSSYGDVFFSINETLPNDKFLGILNHVEYNLLPRLSVCYDSKQTALAALRYNLIKHPRSKTFHLNTSDLLEKSSKSL